MPEPLSILMRWVHISSVATIIGGLIYALLAVAPAMQSVSPETRETLGEAFAARYRVLAFTAIVGLLFSGIYNILANPGHTPRYHMLLGIKLLLVLHVFVVTALIVKPQNPRRERMMVGTVISGLVIILISAYLRRIF